MWFVTKHKNINKFSWDDYAQAVFLYFFYTNKPSKYNELLNVGHIIGK